MGTITPESFSIFRYGLLSQKDQRCSPVICAKEKEKSLNIKKDFKEKKIQRKSSSSLSVSKLNLLTIKENCEKETSRSHSF